MPSTPPDSTHYVYLKFASSVSNNLTINTIPLKATSITITTTKTIPSFDIPIQGIASGESKTAFLDLGMASKTMSIGGIITDQTIVRQFDSTEGFVSGGTGPTMTDDKITIDMTAFEISQLIHSMVDSSFVQDMQNISELVILMESKVDSNYNYRAADKSSSLVPFGYGARGTKGNLDNQGVLFTHSTFPDTTTANGLSGFVRNFSTTHVGETIEVEFNMDFEVAGIFD
tara:strand:+ start:1649 stop:2335 length:687 start_codon:yes stop_codon:yes gene_type:complete